MRFDVATAMLVTSLLTFGVGISLAFAASRYPAELRDTMRVWIGGLFLQALALFAPALLGTAPSGPVIVLSNLVYALAYAEMGRAMALFTGHDRRWIGWLLVVAIGLNSIAFAVLWPRPELRIALNALPLAMLQFAVAYAVLHGRKLRPADVLTGTLFLACSMLALARGVAQVFGPLGPDGVQATVANIVYVFGSILPMLGTIGFMLMCGDRLSDDLERLAMLDPLTGVNNRRTLAGLAGPAIEHALRDRRPLALLAIDVDHFKDINDDHGHDAGDEALLRLVALMRESLAPDHVLSRIGGEEFAVLLPGCDEDAAWRIAERLREHVAGTPFVLGGQPERLNVSIGVATLAGGARDLPALLRDADRALYAAKRSGRNRSMRRSAIVG